MGPTIIKEATCEGLKGQLLTVVADPPRREFLQDLLGPYCHECRNHLNSMKLSLYLAKRLPGPLDPSGWDDLEAGYEIIERFFDHLQQIYRPLSLAPVRLPLGLLLEEGKDAWSEQIGRRGRRLLFLPPSQAVAGDFDPVPLRQALDAFVNWRAEFGRAGQEVFLRWDTAGGEHLVEWHEIDPHASANSVEEDVFPDCLGLPLLARVIAAHGGSLRRSARDGILVTLRWPLECRCP